MSIKLRKSTIVWARRISFSLAVVFIATTITFFLMHLVDGDPFTASIERVDAENRAQYVKTYGLDKPVLIQYAIFLKRLFTDFDLGVSMINRTSTVTNIIQESLGASVLLGSVSVLLGVFLGGCLGTGAAYARRTATKNLLSIACMAGISLPIFIWAPFIQSILGCKYRLLPVSGWGSPIHLFLPVLCMLPNTIATTMKYMRNSVERIRKSDYYILLRQRGFSEIHVFFAHILKNALPAIITILVSSLSGVFTGAFIVEKIFSIPGIGRQFMNAITMRDYTIIIGLNLVFTLVYVIFRLLGDFVQELCNPLFKES